MLIGETFKQRKIVYLSKR